MTQLLTYIPPANPTSEPPLLRLTPRTPTVREELPPVPRAADSPKESVQNTNTLPTPQPAGPEPQADSLPSLEQLLTLYHDPQLTLADIAFTLGLSIPRTLQLVREQHFLDALRVYSYEHEKRAEYLAACNIDTAACTFVRLTSSDKPETARKAAGAIVRMHAETKPPRVSPETQLKAAATLLKSPRHAPSLLNADRKGGGSSKRTHNDTPHPKRYTPSPMPRRGNRGEAIRGRGVSPGKSRTPQRA